MEGIALSVYNYYHYISIAFQLCRRMINFASCRALFAQISPSLIVFHCAWTNIYFANDSKFLMRVMYRGVH